MKDSMSGRDLNRAKNYQHYNNQIGNCGTIFDFLRSATLRLAPENYDCMIRDRALRHIAQSRIALRINSTQCCVIFNTTAWNLLEFSQSIKLLALLRN
jgi:hypothetical protein